MATDIMGKLLITERLGKSGLLIFSFFTFLGTAGANFGMMLMIIAFIMSLKDAWSRLSKNSVARLLVFAAMFLVVHTVWAVWTQPDLAGTHAEEASRWSKLLFFICVAWWFSRNQKLIPVCLMLSLLGFVIGTLFSIDWNNLEELFSGDRQIFHMRANRYAIYSSIGILGLLVFSLRIFSLQCAMKKKVVFVLLWAISILILLEGNFVVQSRGAWLSLILVIPAVASVQLYSYVKSDILNKRILASLVIFLVSSISFLVTINIEKIDERIGYENKVTREIFSGDNHDLPTSSTAYRYNLYLYGVKMWWERPIIGWGAGSTKYLISHSGNNKMKIKMGSNVLEWLDHFHSTYLEILIRFGILGLVICLLLLGMIIKSILEFYRRNEIEQDYMLFLLGGCAITAIWSMFDFRLINPDGRFLWYLLAGLAFSYSIKPQIVVVDNYVTHGIRENGKG